MLTFPSALKFRDSWPLVKSDVIDKLNARLEFPMPGDVRAFLLIQNGSTPCPDSFPFPSPYRNKIEVQTISQFLGFTGEYNDIDWLNFDVVKPRVPNGLFYLAQLAMGDRLFVGLKGSGVEGVYYEDHENEGVDAEGNYAPWWENISRVADSFQDFLYLLGPEEELAAKYE